MTDEPRASILSQLFPSDQPLPKPPVPVSRRLWSLPDEPNDAVWCGEFHD
jgi:hypothetical protein